MSRQNRYIDRRLSTAHQLRARYGENPDGASVFVDESYAEQVDRGGRVPFYLLCGVMIPHADLEEVRADLVDVAGGHYWHTNEEPSAGPAGAARIHEMAEAIAHHRLPAVNVFAAPIREGDLEQARRACIHRLVRVCAAPSNEVGSLVFEARAGGDRGIDQKTFDSYHGMPGFPPTMRLLMAHPTEEHLLWAPDLVAWATRRSLVKDDARFVTPLARQISMVNALTGRREQYDPTRPVNRIDVVQEAMRRGPVSQAPRDLGRGI